MSSSSITFSRGVIGKLHLSSIRRRCPLLRLGRRSILYSLSNDISKHQHRLIEDTSTTSTRSSSSSSSSSAADNSNSNNNNNNNRNGRKDGGDGSNSGPHDIENTRIPTSSMMNDTISNEHQQQQQQQQQVLQQQQQQQQKHHQQEDPNENLRLLFEEFSFNDINDPTETQHITGTSKSQQQQQQSRRVVLKRASTRNSSRITRRPNNNHRLRRLLNELNTTNNNNSTNTAHHANEITQFFLNGGYGDRVAIETIHQTTINHGLHYTRISKTDVDTIFNRVDDDETITKSTSQEEFWKLLK